MVWTSELAYVIGLIVTDGSLSKDGRHIVFVSKDLEQIETFARILNLDNKISTKKSSYNPQGRYYFTQFGNVKLYRFLLDVGLTPNKTKTIGSLLIPKKYFYHFLRGHLDGDGCTYSYWDKRWKSSFMLYTTFVSASKNHIEWIRQQISLFYGINGKVTVHNKSLFYLKYAKTDSIKLLKILYSHKGIPCLSRKRFKIQQALDIITKRAGVMKW